MGNKVYPAEPYRIGELGSFGKANYMLIRQYNFPDEYDPRDQLHNADHDRCFLWDPEHARSCFRHHTGKGDLALDSWVQRASDEHIFAFLRDILKASEDVKWTGYRIMGTLNRSNGYPVWTLELFAKHPDSKAPVYSDMDAPNVLKEVRE